MQIGRLPECVSRPRSLVVCGKLSALFLSIATFGLAFDLDDILCVKFQRPHKSTPHQKRLHSTTAALAVSADRAIDGNRLPINVLVLSHTFDKRTFTTFHM